MLVSVVVPSWNSATQLTDMVEGWLASGSNNIELVVVDDGSTDESSE